MKITNRYLLSNEIELLIPKRFKYFYGKTTRASENGVKHIKFFEDMASTKKFSKSL